MNFEIFYEKEMENIVCLSSEMWKIAVSCVTYATHWDIYDIFILFKIFIVHDDTVAGSPQK